MAGAIVQSSTAIGVEICSSVDFGMEKPTLFAVLALSISVLVVTMPTMPTTCYFLSDGSGKLLSLLADGLVGLGGQKREQQRPHAPVDYCVCVGGRWVKRPFTAKLAKVLPIIV